jgi:hypothetical protein
VNLILKTDEIHAITGPGTLLRHTMKVDQARGQEYALKWPARERRNNVDAPIPLVEMCERGRLEVFVLLAGPSAPPGRTLSVASYYNMTANPTARSPDVRRGAQLATSLAPAPG